MSLNNFPQYFYTIDSDTKFIWKLDSWGQDFVWMVRLGDALAWKYNWNELGSFFHPIRSPKLSSVLDQIYQSERNKQQKHIYDLYIEKEARGEWYKLYQTTIHQTPIKRSPVKLKGEQ
jgi:hypothetical protein